MDFQWNILDPWTIVSVSADCEKTGGGGTLQVRRMSFALCLCLRLSFDVVKYCLSQLKVMTP